MWGAVAHGWAEHAAWADARGAAVAEAMLELASLTPGDRVLELACGPGGAGLAAARRVAPGGEVVLSDVAAEMTAIAAARAEALGLSNVSTRDLDLERVDEPDHSYDAVLCREGLMFALEPDRGAREIRRILRPGGRVALTVWGPRDRNPWLGVVFDAVSAQLGTPIPPLGIPGPFSLADADCLAGLLSDAGLTRCRRSRAADPLSRRIDRRVVDTNVRARGAARLSGLPRYPTGRTGPSQPGTQSDQRVSNVHRTRDPRGLPDRRSHPCLRRRSTPRWCSEPGTSAAQSAATCSPAGLGWPRSPAPRKTWICSENTGASRSEPHATDPEQLNHALNQAEAQIGPPDLIVNAVSASRPPQDGSGFGGGALAAASLAGLDGWTVAVARPSIRIPHTGAHALEGRTGTLVQITGAPARRANPSRGLLAAGGAAVRALTHAAAQELRDRGIHVALLIVDGIIASPKTTSHDRRK